MSKNILQEMMKCSLSKLKRGQRQTYQNINLHILPCGGCRCALTTMGIRKHFLVATARNTIGGKLLHRITITGKQWLLIIPIYGGNTSRLESEVHQLTTGELWDSHTYTAKKDREDQTNSLKTALENKLPLNGPLHKLVVCFLTKAHGRRLLLLALLAKRMIPALAVSDFNLAILQTAILATD